MAQIRPLKSSKMHDFEVKIDFGVVWWPQRGPKVFLVTLEVSWKNLIFFVKKCPLAEFLGTIFYTWVHILAQNGHNQLFEIPQNAWFWVIKIMNFWGFRRADLRCCGLKRAFTCKIWYPEIPRVSTFTQKISDFFNKLLKSPKIL